MIKFENVNVTMQGKRILSDINLEIQDVSGGKIDETIVRRKIYYYSCNT